MTTHTKRILVFATICAVFFYLAVVTGTVWALRHPDKIEAAVRELKMAVTMPMPDVVDDPRVEQARFEQLSAECEEATPGCVEGSTPWSLITANAITVLGITFLSLVFFGLLTGKIERRDWWVDLKSKRRTLP